MMKELTLEDRFSQLIKEAGLKFIESNTGVNLDLFRTAFVVARMLKEGYPLAEVIKTLKKHFMQKYGGDVKAANTYVNKVLGRVNEQLRSETKDDLSKVSAELERHLSSDGLRLSEAQNSKPLTLNQKGNILARMMVVDGFSLPAIEEAASQNKTLNFNSPDELKLVLSSCKAIAERYRLIDEIKLKSPANSFGDMYRQYAKEYMMETRTPFLSPQDDERILATLTMELRYNLSQQLPNTEKGRKELDNYIKTEILPGCSKAVEEASPVAAEGWRNLSQYSRCVIYGTEHFSNQMISQEEKYDKTRGITQKFFDNFDRQQEVARKVFPVTVLDTELAKELLFERQSEALISRAVEENTRVDGRDNFIVRNFSSKRDYANAIVDNAKEAYNREQNLLFCDRPNVPQVSYYQMREQNFSANDLYVEAMKDRLEASPTMRLHMSDAAVDGELVAKILVKHPDVDTDELKEAITTLSPRAAILGISDDYPTIVVERAKKELNKVSKRERQSQEQKNLFNRSRGFAQEAFSEDPMEDYQNCRVAIDMLQEYIPEVDVKQMIRDIAPQEESLSRSPEMYANMIVASAKRVIERSDNIENYSRDGSVPADIKDLYMERAQKILSKKGFADCNMDIEVYKELKLLGCDEVDIQTAIRNYSPSTLEAGRDEGSYCEYVKSSADYLLNQEKDKLDNYLVISRMDVECSPEDEYAFQKKKMEDYISLPFSEAFDTKLARGLLEKKTEEAKVADILDRLSPLAGGNENANGGAAIGYGRSRVAEALQSMKRMVLVDEEVKEDVKVTQHDFGTVKTLERTRTQFFAQEDSGDE